MDKDPHDVSPSIEGGSMKRPTLRNVLSQALHAALATPLVVAAGCGGIDVSSFNSPQCGPGGMPSLSSLIPAMPVDYMEFRLFNEGTQGAPMTTASTGTPCATATDKTACTNELASILETNSGFVSSCGFDGCSYRVLIATRGNQVIVVKDKATLDTFLAPYDTESEAVLAVMTTGKFVSCGDKSEGAVKSVSGGFEVVGTAGSTCGGMGVYQYRYSVDSQGALSELEKAQLKAGDPNCAIGRRPAGFVQDARKGNRRVNAACRPLGRHFAESARLEAASVTAFRVLRSELAAHGAPLRLIRAASRAARDEIRHTQMTTRLARRHGAAPLLPAVEKLPIRTLEAIALENAVEGCVRETYGALVAMWQARRARDRGIARAMTRIARDETRHATLSWEVAKWALPHLSQTSREKIDAARRAAIATLRTELLSAPAPELVHDAGMPAVSDALNLLTQLEQRLWVA
jgi:hypothetical protein